MRRILAICTAAAGVVGAVALAAVANGDDGPRKITLQARSQLDRASTVDNPPAGRSAGDA